MKKNQFKSLTLSLLSLASLIPSPSLSNTNYEKSIAIGGDLLKLNGSGVRAMWLLDIYEAELYLKNRSKNYSEIIESTESSMIQIKILSSKINNENLIETITNSLNESNNYEKDLEGYIQKVNDFFKSQTVETGDIFSFLFSEESMSTTIKRNGNDIGSIEGVQFKRYLFNSWLGKNPVSDSLKSDLLCLDC